MRKSFTGVSVLVLYLSTWPAFGQCDSAGATLIGLGQIPFTVPASGKYVVTENLTWPGSVIIVPAGSDSVEICLGGFTLSGSGSTIDANNTGGTLVVRNGTIQGNFDTAIDATDVQKVVIEEVKTKAAGFTVTGAREVSIRRNLLSEGILFPARIQYGKCNFI